MLILLRILSLAVGAATAWRVLDGTMTAPLFKVADIAVGAALVIAALMPGRSHPPRSSRRALMRWASSRSRWPAIWCRGRPSIRC